MQLVRLVCGSHRGNIFELLDEDRLQVRGGNPVRADRAAIVLGVSPHVHASATMTEHEPGKQMNRLPAAAPPQVIAVEERVARFPHLCSDDWLDAYVSVGV